MSEIVNVLPVVSPADSVAGPAQGRWTYDDYATIPDDGHRYEVVQGMLYMSPAPNVRHQTVVVWIAHYLVQYVQVPGLGRVLVSPIDMELAPKTVVQPDVVVVLKRNEAILHPSRIIGAPDLVVEVASPTTATYDRRTKLEAYARASVPEYWIADPEAQTVELLVLDAGKSDYQSQGVFRDDITLPSRIVPEFPVAVARFFA